MKTMVGAVCLAVLAMCVTASLTSDDADAETDIRISVSSASDGKTFTFTAASAGLWDLGDGTVVSDKASVTHTFAVSGLYRIVLTSADGTVFTVGSNVAITLSVSAPEGLTASVNGTVVTVSGDISGTYALTITASAEGMDDVTVEVPCTVVLRLQLLNLPSNGTLEWIQ